MKTNRTRKLLSLALSLAMVMGMLVLPAHAEFTEDKYEHCFIESPFSGTANSTYGDGFFTVTGDGKKNQKALSTACGSTSEAKVDVPTMNSSTITFTPAKNGTATVYCGANASSTHSALDANFEMGVTASDESTVTPSYVRPKSKDPSSDNDTNSTIVTFDTTANVTYTISKKTTEFQVIHITWEAGSSAPADTERTITFTVPEGVTVNTVTVGGTANSFSATNAEKNLNADKTAEVTFKVETATGVTLNSVKVNESELTAAGGVYTIPASESAQTVTFDVSSNFISATKVELDQTTLKLAPGGTAQTLVATVTPSDSTDAVAWESSEKAVATVSDSGVVTPLAIGKTTITAKAGEQTATCEVSVVGPDQKTSGNNTFIFESKNVAIHKGNDSGKMDSDVVYDDYFTILNGGKLDAGSALTWSDYNTTSGVTRVNTQGSVNTTQKGVKFTTSKGGEAKVWWSTANTGRSVKIVGKKTEAKENATETGKPEFSTFTLNEAGDYIIGGSNGVYIYKIEVTEKVAVESIKLTHGHDDDEAPGTGSGHFIYVGGTGGQGSKDNFASTTLKYPSTWKMDAVVTPATADQGITWSVEPENGPIAVDQDGVVSASGTTLGTRVVVATAKGDTTKVAHCDVTVLPYITGVTIDQTAPSTTVGVDDADKLTLTATLTLAGGVTVSQLEDEQKEIAWSVDDNTVLTVSEDGVVTPLKAGTATVTATTAQLGPRADAKTATVVVTVNAADETGLTVALTTPNNATVIEEGGSLVITATAKLDGTETSDVTYQWAKGGTDIIGETGNTLTVNEAGTYTCTVSGDGKSASKSITITAALQSISADLKAPVDGVTYTAGTPNTLVINGNKTVVFDVTTSPAAHDDTLKADLEIVEGAQLVSYTYNATDKTLTVTPLRASADESTPRTLTLKGTKNSDAKWEVKITVKKLPAPATLTNTDVTTAAPTTANGKGTITIANAVVGTTYRYQADGSETWTDVEATGTTVTINVDPGTYKVRQKVDAVFQNVPGSLTVTVGAYEAPIHSIAVDSDISDGTVETDEEAAEGSTVEVTVTPDDGYRLLKLWYVKAGETAENVITKTGSVYSFTMPEKDVTIYATFEEGEPEPDTPTVDEGDATIGRYVFDAASIAASTDYTGSETATGKHGTANYFTFHYYNDNDKISKGGRAVSNETEYTANDYSAAFTPTKYFDFGGGFKEANGTKGKYMSFTTKTAGAKVGIYWATGGTEGNDESRRPAIVDLKTKEAITVNGKTLEGTAVANQTKHQFTEFTLGEAGTYNLASLGNTVMFFKVVVLDTDGTVTPPGPGPDDPTPSTVAVTGVSLNTTELELDVGNDATLIASVAPANATDKTVTWTSSDTSKVTVDATGKVTAVAAGTAKITVTTTDGGKTAECTVTVLGGGSEPVVVPGNTYTFDATTLTGVNDQKITDPVGTDGFFTPNGDVKIKTASSTGLVLYVEVSKSAKSSLDFTLTKPAKVTVTFCSTGKTNTSKAEMRKDDDTVVPEDTGLTEVTGTGAGKDFVYTDLPAGTYKLVGPSDPAARIIKVVVVENETTTTPGGTVKVTGVTLDKETASVAEGGTVKLNATIAPPDATNKKLSWSTSDPAVATVAADGTVTAVKAGTATITVTTVSGAKTASCDVTVTTSGSVTPPTPSGGGSGGGDMIPTTGGGTTVTNPDGSKTNTKTNKATGTVTETTTYPNGDKTVVVTEKDGTVTETVTKKDGTKTETVSKPDGSSTVAATDAKGIKTEVATSASGEVSAKVSLPKNVDKTVVTIPVKDVTDGTVAVIVKSDGTEQVIKTSMAGEAGLELLVDKNVSVKIKDNAKKFDDIEDGYWAKGAVDFVSSREIFKGVYETVFAPTEVVNRGMMATVLYRLADAKAEGENVFFDVADNNWYTDAVVWANHSGVVTGYADGTFGPADAVTREQMAAMLFRFAKVAGMDVTVKGDVSKFSDGADVSSWASEAMAWAVGVGLVNGVGDPVQGTILAPAKTASRAEVATLMQRMVKLMMQ